MMEIVTRGGFLTSPCKVQWSEKGKMWVWELPTWFEGMGFYSLGTYVAHKLEQAMWKKYFQSHNLNPRKDTGHPLKKGNRETLYEFAPNTKGLHSKAHLINFWNALTAKGRNTTCPLYTLYVYL